MPPPDAPPPGDPPEGEITRYLSRLRNGDRDALNPLFEHTYKRFRELARQVLRGYPGLRGELETDDLLNKSVLALQQTLRAEAGRTPVSSIHLFRFAARKMRHQLIDLVRRVGLQPGANSGLDQVPGAGATPEDLAHRREIHAAVESLDEPLQEVVDLHVYQGLTHADVGRELGMSVKKVGRYWRKALRDLRRELGGGEQ